MSATAIALINSACPLAMEPASSSPSRQRHDLTRVVQSSAEGH